MNTYVPVLVDVDARRRHAVGLQERLDGRGVRGGGPNERRELVDGEVLPIPGRARVRDRRQRLFVGLGGGPFSE